MIAKFLRQWFGKRVETANRKRQLGFRLGLEELESRVLLDAALAQAIVLGRTLSSYFVGSIQSNQETITFTVYNEQSNPVTGVLLTDTLQPGVSYQTASQLPDQIGQQLAWSLGTINGFDRTSVTLTVTLPTTVPLQLDLGAQAFAMLDAGMVSDPTPAATLQPGTVDPSLLASTPDANTTDPFIQEEAAALGYNAQSIFSFMHNDIGYNSYLGSVRGARGTLWSDAGNALDVASLGVALMRASGIPAQYVQGTLSSSHAQSLILSMFPASNQMAGYIPAGTQTAEPATDPQLLAETESHYWFQFNTGSGFQDADPLIGTAAGQTFTSSQGTFTEVPDDLREKTEVTLNAEIYSEADAAFGLGLTTTTVLDQTFNDVDLVGRPLTIGNFVNSTTTGGLVFTTVTNTYSPYVEVSDEAYPDTNQDQVIRGQDYQEILTNFPLGSQILTGLFLNFTMTGPQGPPATYTKTLVDRIGFAARQAGGTVQLAPVDPSGPPILSEFDLWTVNALPGLQSSAPLGGLGDQMSQLQNQQNALLPLLSQIPDSGPQNVNQAAILGNAMVLDREIVVNNNLMLGIGFAVASDQGLANLEIGYDTKAFYVSPRLIVSSTSLGSNGGSSALDLVKNDLMDYPMPGQAASAGFNFEIIRGMFESSLEGKVLAASTGQPTISMSDVIAAMDGTTNGFAEITSANIQILTKLPLSDTAKARITQEVNSGQVVLTPMQMVVVDGQTTVGWLEIDPTTGHTISVMEDGGHEAEEYGILIENLIPIVFFGEIGLLDGFSMTSVTFLAKVIGGETKADAFNDVGQDWANSVLATYFHLPNYADPNGIIDAAIDDVIKALSSTASDFKSAFDLGTLYGAGAALAWIALNHANDPPVLPMLTTNLNDNQAIQTNSGVALSSNASSGAVIAALSNAFVSTKHISAAVWSSHNLASFLATSLVSSDAIVANQNGQEVGAGLIALQSLSSPLPVAITGNVAYGISGQGSLSFFGPAETTLGVSANWDNYTATVTGSVSITVTTNSLTLNGQILPVGTYTITTSAATLAGSGETTSPNFSGSASITTTAGTVDLGAGTGTVTIGGNPVSPMNGITLAGYSGNLTVSATGTGTDSVTLSGSSANVLRVSPNPATLTTDQNTPVTFQANVQTSFADTYTLTAQAPSGWTVSIDNNGNITATPAPGLQSGTYPVQIIAQSTTNPDLVAQATVNVTIKATVRSITMTVAADPLTTVPFNGAELPTAFVATIHNNGPTTLTTNLSFSNLPSGFTLLDSGTSVTLPAGATGSVGIYLQPTSQISAPGSQFSFTVTATVTAVQVVRQTVTFTVPAIDAINLTSGSPTINAAPGATTTEPITITAVGNVAENVTLAASGSTGLTVAGLSNVSLQPGQAVTENVSLTPDASISLNSFLQAAITATFGPSNALQTETLNVPVNVVVPGALAITSAVTSANQLGETSLVAQLNDLSGELTNLTLTPTDPVAKSQVLASFSAVIGLFADDDYLASLTTTLTKDTAALAQAASVADVNNALSSLGNDLGSIATTLSDEIAHSLVLQLVPNQGQASPNVAVLYPLLIQNTGTQTTTYDLSVSGLPANVTASLNETSVTLTAGQQSFGGPNEITLSLTETGGTLLATGFSVTATAEGAPEINRSATGSLTVRNAFVQVTKVTPNPTFTNPGAKVDVSAQIVNVTANTLTAQAFYTVTDPNGNIVFTSSPISVPFSVFVAVTTVDLGSFDTTALAAGSYTIGVFVTDAAGKPLTNVVGQGSVLIGTPLTASLTSVPGAIFPFFEYAQGITNTVKVDTTASFASPLTLAGIVATDATETTVALNGTLAYVVGTKDVSIIDTSSSSNPQVIGTFGSNVITQGNFSVCKISGNLLLIGSESGLNATFFNFLVYNIANPLSPTLVSNTQINYRFIADMVIEGTTAYFPLGGINFIGGSLLDQFGDFVSVDFSNPAQPHLADVLFNNRGAPDGGNFQENGAAVVNNQITYVATTTSQGSNGETGSGQLLIVNTSNPANLSVAGTLNIPDTVRLLDIAIDGNRALAIGSTGGDPGNFGNIANFQLTGTLTLTPLDITNPLNPQVIGPTLVTEDTFLTDGADAGGKLDEVDLGNGIYAISNTQLNGNPVLLLVNSNDPNHMIVGATQAPAIVNGMTVSGNLLYATTQVGLSIYNIGQVLGVPVTVSVVVPTGAAVIYDPTTFNIVPSQIVHGTGFDTLTWVSSLGAGITDLTLTWTSNLSANQPPETVPVVLGATVSFISQGTPGVITLPGTDVTVPRYGLIDVFPNSNTVQPGVSAAYTVEIERSLGTPHNYNITVVGLPAGWVSVPATVTVPPDSYLKVPLNVLSDPAAPLGTYNFTVVVTDGTITDSWQLSLVLKGTPVLPATDPDSHGVVAILTPTQASAGQGTSASYVVQLTNTGSADDSFTLSAAGLPPGVAATFAQTTIDVPPGASNFRDVALTLTPQLGTAPGPYNFTVTATSATMSSIANTASGMLTVLGNGVSVALTPASGPPGNSFQMTVTNTGKTQDTFDLALAGPAALVSALGLSKVTLGAGAKQVVSISTGSVNFAVPGNLELDALATSETNPSVLGDATANLSIPAVAGMTASFSPASQIIPAPGTGSFLLQVNNTGNVEDAYTATITGTSGGVSANLTGLDGLPTQTIPTFRLPGLSTGEILVNATLASQGKGTVTVQITSLTNGTITSNSTATLIVPFQPTASSQHVTIGENSPVNIGLAGSDPDSPALPLSFVVTASPAHGTLSGTAPNLTYTPNAGYFGSDSFMFKTNNGYVDSTLATVSITVVAPPTATGFPTSTAVNTAKTITLTASDPNTPPLTLTYIITANPSHGTLGSASGNSITYTPSANYFGPDSFQFKANNGTSDSNIATVSITVNQAALATISSIAVQWGSGTASASLLTASDGLRLLPAGRNNDLPWPNVKSLTITLGASAILNPADISATGITLSNYGPVTVSGSGTSYKITFAQAITKADRVTILIGNAGISTYLRRLDVLPGDTDDSGGVNVADGVLILNNTTPAHTYSPFLDMNGDGTVTMADFTAYTPFITTTLPALRSPLSQLAVGGRDGDGALLLSPTMLAPALQDAIAGWANAGLSAAELTFLYGVTVQITNLPPGYLGFAPIGSHIIYLSANAAGFGWTNGPAPGHEDLATVMAHELGHLLGLYDLDPRQQSNDLMSETLPTGVSRTPTRMDLAAIDAVHSAHSRPPMSMIQGIPTPGPVPDFGAFAETVFSAPGAFDEAPDWRVPLTMPSTIGSIIDLADPVDGKDTGSSLVSLVGGGPRDNRETRDDTLGNLFGDTTA